jgi:RNA polymerase sigma factor for flagellar operon FliA
VTLLGRSEEESLIDGKPMAHDELERHQLSHRVRRALARLPDKERYLIETYYFEDQTLEQVGARMGLSKSWTSRLHTRAIDKLGRLLKELVDEHYEVGGVAAKGVGPGKAGVSKGSAQPSGQVPR